MFTKMGEGPIKVGFPCILGGQFSENFGYTEHVGKRAIINGGGIRSTWVTLEENGQEIFVSVQDCIPGDIDNAFFTEHFLKELDAYGRDLPRLVQPVYEGPLKYCEEGFEDIPEANDSSSERSSEELHV